MSIADKLTQIAENEPKVYDAGEKAGKQSEYDRFWDAFQNKGERTVYWYGFSGYGWTNDTLCPKYPITFSESATEVSGLFYRCGGNGHDATRPFETCIDFSKIQDKFDFSRTTNVTDAFNSCFMVNIYANLANCTSTQRIFARTYGGYMESITVKVSEKLTNCSSMFQNCGATKIIFTEDSVIACNGMNQINGRKFKEYY